MLRGHQVLTSNLTTKGQFHRCDVCLKKNTMERFSYPFKTSSKLRAALNVRALWKENKKLKANYLPYLDTACVGVGGVKLWCQ